MTTRPKRQQVQRVTPTNQLRVTKLRVSLRCKVKVGRSKVLELAHDRYGHLGWKKKVQPMIRRNFACPLMSMSVKDYCSSCEPCQRNKRSLTTRPPMVTWAIRTLLLEQVAIDLVGLF